MTTLITGLPRSGTTLTVAILNDQPNCVALAEPLPLASMPDDPEEFSKAVGSFAGDMRQSALRDRLVRTKSIGGLLSSNFVKETDRGEGLRKSEAQNSTVAIDKEIDSDFQLYIKHPAAFTALTDTLSSRFPLFACIRSPLAVLASWQTVDMPVNRGRVPMAERFSPELSARLDAIPDALSRQVYLMRWFLEAYASMPRERILRFEDLIEDTRSALANICPGNTGTRLELQTIDIEKRYPSVDIDRLRHALKPIDEIIRYHYPEGMPR
ncbi:MAG: hypothetical protein R3D45_06810 [Rhizobiaceae bacterium]